MPKTRNEIVELAKELDKILKEKKIWYSLDDYTLLGAVRHGGFVPWVEKFQIMIDVEGYGVLKRNFSKNIIDSSIDSSFKSKKAAWVVDNKMWKVEQPYIEISIIIPSTIKKVVHFASKIHQVIRKLKWYGNNIKSSIDELYDDKYEGFFVMGERSDSIKESWMQALSFETEEKKFFNVPFPVIKEYDKYLKNRFGANYFNNAVVPPTTHSYPFPSSKVEEFQ